MTELKILKTKLEEELKIINEALKIQDKYNGGTTQTRPKYIEPDDIGKTILNINNEFTSKNVYDELLKNFSEMKEGKIKPAIANALHRLCNEGKLQYVRERAGRRPAIYRRKN